MSRQYGALSGLAMVLIVLNHAISVGLDTSARAGNPLPQGWVSVLLTALQGLGLFAVPTFLFISGSFITYAALGAKKISPKFLWKSLQHILWPYLIWSLIFYLVVYLRHSEEYTLFGYIKNLLVGYPFHFIPLLAFYYLLSPFLIYAGRKYGWGVLAVIGAFQLFLIAIRDPGIFGFVLPEWTQRLAPPVLFNTMADWAIYFPLGLVFSLHVRSIRPRLMQLKSISLIVTFALFVLGLLDVISVAHAPWARYSLPVPFMLLAPVIDRNAIPQVRLLEKIGRRAYGVYLTHLVVLDIFLFGIQALTPWLLKYRILLLPLLFFLGLQIPMWIMDGVARAPARKVYRYVFG